MEPRTAGEIEAAIRYAPIVLLALSVLEAFVGLMNGSEGLFLWGLVEMIVYGGCAVLGRKFKSQVEVENERRYAANEWTDGDKEVFKRLMYAQRQSGG